MFKHVTAFPAILLPQAENDFSLQTAKKKQIKFEFRGNTFAVILKKKIKQPVPSYRCTILIPRVEYDNIINIRIINNII